MTPTDHPIQSPSSRLLTPPQVAELLGVDRSTVYRMAADGRLPPTSIGDRRRLERPCVEMERVVHAGRVVNGPPLHVTDPAGDVDPVRVEGAPVDLNDIIDRVDAGLCLVDRCGAGDDRW